MILGNSIRLLAIILTITIVTVSLFLNNKTMTVPDDTVVSDITNGDSKLFTTASTSASSVSGGSQCDRHRRKWNNSKPQVPTRVAIKNDFKGSNTEVSGSVFIKGPTQAASYDEEYNALMTYFGGKYDQMMYRAYEQKDSNVGRKFLLKPSTLMIDKVVQIATLGADSKLIGEVRSVLDKEGEAFITYQIKLKQYIGDV